MASQAENAVKFELKLLSNQLEKKTRDKISKNGVGDKILYKENLATINKN